MSKRIKSREWIIIIAVAIVIHVALFFFIRPSFFSAFRKTIDETSETGEGQPFTQTAILTIPIEIDDVSEVEEQNPVQETAEARRREEKRHQEVTRVILNDAVTTDEGPAAEAETDVDNLSGQSPQTLPHNIGPEAVVIPPRALEITWPDTRKLRHCLGHHIDIRIQVAEDGAIARVEALSNDHPPDCIRAALESARRIVFEPGQKDGRPTTMWTQVRIDFRKKK